MPLPNPATMTAVDLAALTADEVAKLAPQQLEALAKRQDELRWAAEGPYFSTLHEYLPEPFFHTSGFLLFCLTVLAIYWMVPRKYTAVRVWVLVLASFHFYAAWSRGARVFGHRHRRVRLHLSPRHGILTPRLGATTIMLREYRHQLECAVLLPLSWLFLE